MDDAAAARSLLSAHAVRERAHEMLAAGLRGDLAHFTIDIESLGVAAQVVSELIRVNYPDGNVPFHARWRHFVLGGRDLWAERVAQTSWSSPAAKARAIFAIVGAARRRRAVMVISRSHDGCATRSEGLGVAACACSGGCVLVRVAIRCGGHGSCGSGPMTSRPACRHVGNLVGIEARRCSRPGGGCGAPRVFLPTGRDRARPPTICGGAENGRPPARASSRRPSPASVVWPSRIALGVPLGDTAPSGVKRADATDGLGAIHKLSQWLAYSLIEPQRVGHRDRHRRPHRAPAAWRLLIPGVLRLRNPEEAIHPNPVDSTLVVEWRALTVALLDQTAALIRERRSLTIDEFPLARVLEGGTWAAGRRLARDKRPDGSPPIAVVSDGTVF